MSFTYKLQQYLRYKLRAKNEFSLHSPFMFDLYNEVFKKAKKKDLAFLKIENKRNTLLKNDSAINFIDFGAGSAKNNSPIRRVSSITKNTSKSKKHGRFLALLANYLKSKNILELGTSVGISTMYIAEKNKNASITTIEGCKEIMELASHNFNELQFENIIFLGGKFDDILPVLLNKQVFDFIFIDGNHTHDATLRYFDMIKEKSSNDTVIVFDDIYWNKEMTIAWKKIINDDNITASIDMFEFGIVFFNTGLSKQHFTLRF